MSFLPVVERELRVAARRRGTFWTRLIAALLALLIASGILVLAQLGGRGSVPFGLILFQVLGWMCFVFALSAGVVLTADCLSEERREGTLGLLFLTDLRSYDVVFGKLLATSLWAAYGLLAVFPVLAMSFLLGGVTGGHFWRHLLAVGNALFFSLSLGLWVSSRSRESQKAMSGTLVVGLGIVLGLPLIDWCIAQWGNGTFVPRLTLASPFFACLEANLGRGLYWSSLGAVHLVGWGFLAWSCRLARRRLDETGTAGLGAATPRSRRWRYGAPAWREAWRRRMLDRNPIAWLTSRDLWLRRVAGGLVALGLILSLAAVGFAAWITSGTGLTEWASVLSLVGGLLSLALTLWVAVQASRFFVEGVQTRALEQILVTPLSVEEILQGQWAGLRRAFLLPVCLLLILNGGAAVLQVWQFLQMQPTPPAAAGISFSFVGYQITSAGLGLVGFITGFLALAEFSMWMGLTSRKVPAAVIKAVVFVKILPGLVFAFAQGLLMFATSLAQWPSWVSAALVGSTGIGVDLGFFFLARNRLRTRMREIVTQTDRLPSSAPRPPFSGLRPPPA
jgi:hypothetical protein